MKYSWKNIQYAFVLAAITGCCIGCADDNSDDFGMIVPKDKPKTIYNPWYPDDEQEDALELEAISGGWDSHVTVKKDRTYDRYFTRDYGMNGCDGVYTTELPDGNIFWSFGDSYFGQLLDHDRRIRGGNESNFPRNAVMIQTKQNYNGFHCLNELVQIDDKFRMDYYKGRTFLRHPKGEMSDTDIEAGKIDQQFYYWPGDATVIERDGKKILQVLWGECFKNASGGMDRDGTALTEYELTGNPGDAAYMKQINYLKSFVPYAGNYGSAIWEDEDGHTYLYADADRGGWAGGKGPVVARSKTHDLTSGWEFYVKKGDQFRWQDEPPTADEKKNSHITTWWGAQPNVFKKNGVYYMVIQEPLGKEVWLFKGEHPWGPFGTDELGGRKKILELPEHLDKLGDTKRGSVYNVFVHHGLSKEGELVVSMNVDAPSFEANFNSVGCADFYRPYFYRIYNWESAFQN